MADRSLSAYVHVPFCSSRCGYCDFNTYTAAELSRDDTKVSVQNYAQYVVREIDLTARNEESPFANDQRQLDTVFFGGGTPTLLTPADLIAILKALKNGFGLATDAEVTIEANPDSVTLDYLEELRAGGFTRISFGHQSSSKTVLQVLERTHTAGRTWEAVQWAKEAGFDHINVDLIYASPLETDDDLELTLTELAAAPIDHVSAYSLIVEPGTRMAGKVNRGELPPPSDDVAAHRYEMIERRLVDLGFSWYEVSNWAKPNGQCRHNLAYWQNQDWLGIGPGAHGHIEGLRQWKVKHPAAWAQALSSGLLPIADQEELSAPEVKHEDIMLGLRLRSGLALEVLSEQAVHEAELAVAEGLLEASDFMQGRAVLTLSGRLLADGLVARLWD